MSNLLDVISLYSDAHEDNLLQQKKQLNFKVCLLLKSTVKQVFFKTFQCLKTGHRKHLFTILFAIPVVSETQMGFSASY